MGCEPSAVQEAAGGFLAILLILPIPLYVDFILQHCVDRKRVSPDSSVVLLQLSLAATGYLALVVGLTDLTTRCQSCQ